MLHGGALPLVQQKRAGRAGRRGAAISTRNMLFFAGFSTGILALFAGFFAAIVIVGVYVGFVWPLTFWDLANLHLERFSSWTSTIVGSVFVGGFLAGCWAFSGAAFKGKPKTGGSVSATPSHR